MDQTSPPLLKRIQFKLEEERLKVKKEEYDQEEDIDLISLSEKNIDTEDKIFGQFVKVNKTKQKYRCEFVDVVAHIQGTDYIIRKLNAEIAR